MYENKKINNIRKKASNEDISKNMKGKEEKISVIVPIYNVEKYLRKCLNSIISQTYKNIEIILVDDGSTDSSGKIIDEFKINDNRILVIHKQNGGLSDARNEGIKKASGKYIAFIDSDDFINEMMLEMLIKNIEKYNADISICSYENIFDNDVCKKTNNNNLTCYNAQEALEDLLNNDKKITNHAWNKLYKKELFDEITYPKGRNFEDIATTYKLLEISKIIVYSDFVGYYYRQHQRSITGNINLKTMKDSVYAIKERYNYLIDKYPKLQKMLLRNRANNSLLYHTGLAKINEKMEYFSAETINEYNFFLNYVRRYSFKDILIDNTKTYKVFAILLRVNRKKFYGIVSNLFKLKRRLKKWKK